MSVSKRKIWLSYFLDPTNKRTFLHQTESARAAGYNYTSENSLSGIGSMSFKRCKAEIEEWLDEAGLSEAALKLKLLSLLDAKETKFFAHAGIVEDSREVEAIETQRKALDMAFRVKGSYAPEKREHAGPGGGPIKTENATITGDMSEKEAAEIYARLVKGQNE